MEPLGIITRGYQRAGGGVLELLIITRGYLSEMMSIVVSGTVAMDSDDPSQVAMTAPSADQVQMRPNTG